MADKPWKAFEREAAALFGGKRKPANSGHRLDFESDTTIGQCKLVRVLSLEALTQLAEEMEREALPQQKAGVVKVRRGRGSLYMSGVWSFEASATAAHGQASDQEGAPIPSTSPADRRSRQEEGPALPSSATWMSAAR